MTETTQEERETMLQTWRDSRSLTVPDGLFERLVADADGRAAIERQVIYRTGNMPEWATDWEKEDGFCRWTNYWDDNLADIAPDLRPDSALPIRLPIIDAPDAGGEGT